MNNQSLSKLIDRVEKDFGGDTVLQRMIFITYKGKLNVKKEMAIMKAFPEYNFYFISKGSQNAK